MNRGGAKSEVPALERPLSGLPQRDPTAYEKFLRQHSERVGKATPVSEWWRDESSFSFADCAHTVETIVEIDNEFGKWGLAICVRCAHVNTVECPHAKNEWYLDGRVLVCLNCGKDGT